MNYIYDILLNFNKELYDFYDWDRKDDIKHIRRIPIIKVSSDDFITLKENDVVVDKNLLHRIYNKTEIFEQRKILRLEYACLFCDGLETIGISFDDNGESLEKTKLLIDEDNEVLDICVHLNEEKIDYNILKSNKPEYLKTRKEIQRRKFILQELQKLSESQDYEKLRYLYYECFNKKEDSVNKMMSVFTETLDTNFNSLFMKLYDFFKLTSLNK